MRLWFFIAGMGIALAVFAGSLSAKEIRGVSVKLRTSEAKGAGIIEEVELYSKSYALVIGNDMYRDRAWPRLSQAVSDAKKVAAALEAKGFDVILETNLDASALSAAFEDFFIDKGADPDARLFVWYAGHGHTDTRGEGYLIPVDGVAERERKRFLRTALSLRDFGKYVRLAESKHVLTIFDSCFSGTIFQVGRSAPPSAITKVTTRAVRQFLTSGDKDQQVSDDGTFAKLFVEAVAGRNRADANADGYLTGSEIGAFLTYEISNYSQNNQTPRFGPLRDPAFSQGDFVFQLAAVALTKKVGNSGGGQTPEIVFWQSIQGSDDPDLYQAYLKQFPNGSFAGLAKLKIDKLGRQVAVARPPNTSPPPKAIPAVGGHPPAALGKAYRDCPDCPEMIVIPAGRFRMGDLSGAGANEEKPVHEVRIGYSFAVGKYEVTQDEWVAVMGANPSQYKGSRNPVEKVSWKDAKAFVDKLSAKTGNEYRLLSEAEWEYMARAGSTSKYP